MYIGRVENIIGNKEAVERLFHHSEIKNSDVQHLAGVLAVKEAFFKALKKKPRWLDVELKKGGNGEPFLKLKPSVENSIKELDVSISHEKDYAVAQVVLKKKPENV